MQGCSPSSPAGPRLWRPAAQRSLRNSWSLISSHLSAWSSSSSHALSAASSLVNALLSYRYVEFMDFGVLKAMKGIRANARKKYLHRGEVSFMELIKSFEELVENLSAMLNAKGRMRAYLKGPSSGNLVEFSDQRHLSEDTGDGDGLAVFSALSVSTHEMLAQELIDMFVAEIKVKWLIVSELHSSFYSGAEVDCTKAEALTELMQSTFVETTSKLPEVFNNEHEHKALPLQQGSEAKLKREVLQVEGLMLFGPSCHVLFFLDWVITSSQEGMGWANHVPLGPNLIAWTLKRGVLSIDYIPIELLFAYSQEAKLYYWN